MLGAHLDIWLRSVLQSTTSKIAVFNWQPRPGWLPVQILVYFVIIYVAYELITLPLGYYSGFILPRRYKISGNESQGVVSGSRQGLCFEPHT